MVSTREQHIADAIGMPTAGIAGATHFNIYDNHLTKSQLAKAIGRNEKTLDNWWRKRQGPPRIKFEGIVLYNIHSFNKWLASQEMEPGAKVKPNSRGRPRKRKQLPAAAAAE
jgi:hypothetical protein